MIYEAKLVWRIGIVLLAVGRLVRWSLLHSHELDTVTTDVTAGASGSLIRFLDISYSISLWVSLPLAVWFCEGWIGLLVHWQVLARTASLFQGTNRQERFTCKSTLPSEGEASCSVISPATC